MKVVEQSSVEAYLDDRSVGYEIATHPGTFTARSEAAALGRPSDTVLKTILLRLDGGYAIAVIPASRKLNLSRIAKVAKSERVALATEEEIASRFPGFELGALPPFPGLLGVPGFIDQAVFEVDQVAFADGKRTESAIARPGEMFWGEDVFVGSITQKPDGAGPWPLAF